MLPFALVIYCVFLIAFFGAALISSSISYLANFIAWFIHSLAVMKMSKKLQVKHGWFAFIPLLSAYLHGKMAEASVAKRSPEKKPFRWGALNLAFYIIISLVVFAVQIIGVLVSAVIFGDLIFSVIVNAGMIPEDLMSVTALLQLLSAVFSLCAISVLAVIVEALVLVLYAISSAQSVFDILIRYKIYACLAPQHAMWMTVAAIICPFVINLPVVLILDLILGFTNLLAPKVNNTENKETVSDTDSN